MTLEKVIHSLKQANPADLKEIMEDCKLPLKYVSSGCYRTTFSVIGTGSVIKVPHRPYRQKYDEVQHKYVDVYSSDVEHAQQEIEVLKKIHKYKRFSFLHPYLPEFYYYSEKTGICLVKRYYKIGSRQHKDLVRELTKKIKKVFKLDSYNTIDLHGGNFAEDKSGSLKLIDLGMFDGW